MKKYAVISVSGGMDSTSLLLRLIREDYTIYAVSFYYGQKHSLEIERLKSNLKYIKSKTGITIAHNVVDISSIMQNSSSALTKQNMAVPQGHYEEEQMKQTVVPNRNAIFSSIIYSYALSLAIDVKQDVMIALGVHSGDHAIYPDCRPEFYKKIMDAFNYGNWDSEYIKLYIPYIDGDKVTILKDAEISCSKLGLEFDEVMKRTCTSYDPTEDGLSSGKTGSDIERILAFYEIGKKDPVPYVDGWENSLKYALKIKEDYESREKNKHI